MRENRPYGSEGGESGSTRLPYPYRSGDRWLPPPSGDRWLRLGNRHRAASKSEPSDPWSLSKEVALLASRIFLSFLSFLLSLL